MKIIDRRTIEGKAEYERRSTALDLIATAFCYDKELTTKPGQFIEWMRSRYKNIHELKEEDFR